MQIRKWVWAAGSLLLSGLASCQQPPSDRPALQRKAFDEELAGIIDFSCPIMGIDTFLEKQSEAVVLDTRSLQEFKVSHIPNAIYAGYGDFKSSDWTHLPKDTLIVVYCSVGVRSGKVGKKLVNEGYSNVHNLYGSIFEWVNQGGELEGADGKPTRQLHTYNKKWSQWVDHPKIKKVW